MRFLLMFMIVLLRGCAGEKTGEPYIPNGGPTNLLNSSNAGISNVSETPIGEVYGRLRSATQVPAAGNNQAELTISANARWNESLNANGPFTPKSRSAVVFHEFAESYERTTNKSRYEVAHSASIKIEQQLPEGDSRRSLYPGIGIFIPPSN